MRNARKISVALLVLAAFHGHGQEETIYGSYDEWSNAGFPCDVILSVEFLYEDQSPRSFKDICGEERLLSAMKKFMAMNERGQPKSEKPPMDIWHLNVSMHDGVGGNENISIDVNKLDDSSKDKLRQALVPIMLQEIKRKKAVIQEMVAQ